MGLVDVKRMAEFYPTFLLDRVYAHGQWYYFPLVILIKTTIGLLLLLALAIFAMFRGKLPQRRALIYVLLPPLVYLLIAMGAGMDIGARHLLPIYAFLIIFAAAGAVALARSSPRWAIVCALLVAAHIISSLLVFPNEMAYANEAWGGPKNVHNLLSDANVDWAQQLLQVKHWQDQHPDEPCWFAYFARPEIDPGAYGIRCHALPTLDTDFLGGAEITPSTVQGTILISAGDLSGCEWPDGQLNPYRSFQARRPDEVLDDSVFIYRGTFAMPEAAALSRAQHSTAARKRNDLDRALVLAREAVSIDGSSLFAQTALGNADNAVGDKNGARLAWQAAVEDAKHLTPEAQVSYIPELQTQIGDSLRSPQ